MDGLKVFRKVAIEYDILSWEGNLDWVQVFQANLIIKARGAHRGVQAYLVILGLNLFTIDIFLTDGEDIGVE